MPYTPGQVTEMLDIPPSSLRRLSREFSDFLSKSPGRHRRFTEQDIDVLRRVREATDHGKTLVQIKQELSVVETPAERPPLDTLALVPVVAQELERLDSAWRAVLGEVEQLRADRETDRERLRKLEAWAALPWYRRLFTRPPV